MLQNTILTCPQCRLRKPLPDKPPLPTMHVLVRSIKDALHRVESHYFIGFSFRKVRIIAIYFFHALDIIDEDPAWSIADNGAVSEMETVNGEMSILAPGVVEAVGVCEPCKEWAGDVGEGVEKESVYTDCYDVDENTGT